MKTRPLRMGDVLTDHLGRRWRIVSLGTSAQLGFLQPTVTAVRSTPAAERALARIMPLPDDEEVREAEAPEEGGEEEVDNRDQEQEEEAHDLPLLSCPLCRMLLDKETLVPRTRLSRFPDPGFLNPVFTDDRGRAHQHIVGRGVFRYRCREGHEWDEHHPPVCPARGCLWGVSESRPSPSTFR